MSDAPAVDVRITPPLDASWPKDGLGSVGVILAALPDPSSLARGAVVAITAGDPLRRGFGRLFRAPPFVHLAVRCAALLAKGYVDVGATDDGDGRKLAVGRAP